MDPCVFFYFLKNLFVFFFKGFVKSVLKVFFGFQYFSEFFKFFFFRDLFFFSLRFFFLFCFVFLILRFYFWSLRVLRLPVSGGPCFNPSTWEAEVVDYLVQASLVYRVSSRTARDTQRNPTSKTNKKTKKQKKKKKK